MLSLKQINDKVVRAIPIPNEDKRPIKGFDICEEVYANIFLCAKKKSGKTSALFKIMKECAIKKTVIIVFCSTCYKDKNWIQIRKHFDKKGMDIRVFTSIFEDGEDQLNKLIQELSEEAKEKEHMLESEVQQGEEELTPDEKCDEILQRLSCMHSPANPDGYTMDENLDQPKKERKSKYQAPEYMIVFDDLSDELKSKSLFTLMKKNRHFKTKLIISSQWLHDLLPESRKQLDLFIIFKGFPEKKLIEIYKDCDSGVPFETFYKMYKKATKRPFSFFYIDARSDMFRRNFNEQFTVTAKEGIQLDGEISS